MILGLGSKSYAAGTPDGEPDFSWGSLKELLSNKTEWPEAE